MPRPTLLSPTRLSSVPRQAFAASAHYTIDPNHTYPSFEADHMGISVWRGKLDRSSGGVDLDTAAGTGRVDVSMDLSSIDFGLASLNTWAKGGDLFDVAKFPSATYTGTLTDFVDGRPTRVAGTLTLHGVSKPVDLAI